MEEVTPSYVSDAQMLAPEELQVRKIRRIYDEYENNKSLNISKNQQ